MIKGIAYKITSLLLVSILLANNINTLAIVGDFVINQDFIAKTLCIQKEDQQGCNGKCHLKKQLAKNNTDTNTESPSPENKRTYLDTFYLVKNDVINKNLDDIISSKKILIHTSNRITKTLLEVETPPPSF
ncbi:hypothetical protein [Cognatitamlana onchidii]|uniref:hypothetical protein n=1 Tax=Cognatitamlana onchidii TaxID=2562860 RepID=UPI0010A6009E|nr:hypothetical protein [Algibacter onchidii]